MAALFSFFASQKHRQVKERAQAITEFAIVLPILIVLLVGILEAGRMIFIYAAVNNGSREAARYASAAGLNDSSPAVEKYRDCIGIRDMAKRSAFFVPLTIIISYDHGSTTTTFDTCDGNTDTGIVVNSGTNRDRATITVSANYSPMVNLIPFGTRTFTSISSRTILGIFELDPVTISGGGGGATDTPTATSTVSGGGSTATPTETPTYTPTPGAVYTLTPTSTPIPYATATSTPTDVPPDTATPTPTSAPACQSPSLSSISSSNKTISTTISNPNSVAVTITSVQLSWNRATGGPGGNVNDLKSASLGSGFWSGTNATGTFSMGTSLTVLGYSSSAMTFTFDKNYQSNTNASVTLVISVTGCGTYTVSTP